MWNEPDVDLVRGHLDQAVSETFVFSDPQQHHVGREALAANVVGLRTDKPRYRFVIATELDRQHDVYRYEWRMMSGSRVLLRGLDIARLGSDGLLDRVDGFFGSLTPMLDPDAGSLIPASFRLG